jgi:hypothetical protein
MMVSVLQPVSHLNSFEPGFNGAKHAKLASRWAATVILIGNVTRVPYLRIAHQGGHVAKVIRVSVVRIQCKRQNLQHQNSKNMERHNWVPKGL